jgi:hypothetical protein
MPDYDYLRDCFASLRQRIGYVEDEPLDWTPCSAPGNDALPKSSCPPEYDGPDDGDELDDDDEDDKDDFSDSYYEVDLEMYDRMGGRDADLTMPLDTEAELDCLIPVIEDVPPRRL